VNVPFVLCRCCDEAALGGRVIRIKLYPDASGVVRDTEVVRDGGWLDGEHCLLPDSDDSAARIAWKAALFPIPEVARVTLGAASFTLACTASPGLR
jgi:hypothetical protein